MTEMNADLIEAFSGLFLSPMFDNKTPTPPFHREVWDLYCKDYERVAVAAPRSHAKSTALTHSFSIATGVFREQDFIVIVSATEDLAIGHLGDIARQFRENQELRLEFGIKRLVSDAKTDIVVECNDGHQFRYVAKGSGQKMRGMIWRGRRPGLIICDDMEDDEQVESRDRRAKFRHWFQRALVPTVRKEGKIRAHGTILHEESLLATLINSPSWASAIYKAHRSFDEFDEILWPGYFTEARLREIQQGFINNGDPGGYSQEYLNNPFDNSEAYLRPSDFIPMSMDDAVSKKVIAVGCDFAVSKSDKANRTSFTIGGRDANNVLHFIDQYVGRWDAMEWVNVLLDIQRRWNPDCFYVEDGVIWKTISPSIFGEMRRQNTWMNCYAINPTKDKATRGRPFQKRMRAGACRFDKSASWYPGFENELLRFTGLSDAVLDDQFDSAAILAKGIEMSSDVDEESFIDDRDYHDDNSEIGRSTVTGY